MGHGPRRPTVPQTQEGTHDRANVTRSGRSGRTGRQQERVGDRPKDPAAQGQLTCRTSQNQSAGWGRAALTSQGQEEIAPPGGPVVWAGACGGPRGPRPWVYSPEQCGRGL